jgi:Cu+-exporting ATPase
MRVKDPICGKEVDPLRARAVGIFGGVTYYFCSPECKARYVDPRKTPREPPRSAAPPSERESPPPAAAAPPPVTDATRDGAADDEVAGSERRGELTPSAKYELERIEATPRRWALVIVILAALVAVSAVLFFRN